MAHYIAQSARKLRDTKLIFEWSQSRFTGLTYACSDVRGHLFTCFQCELLSYGRTYTGFRRLHRKKQQVQELIPRPSLS
jgi:hypothetical protein